MASLLSIDPGTKAVGWALFENSVLSSAGLSLSRALTLGELCSVHSASIPQADVVVCEQMEYHPGRGNSFPASLLLVQWVGAFLCANRARDTSLPLLAREWKGNIPKEIHHGRIVQALSEQESNVLCGSLLTCRKSNHKELLDAVGIGLYHLNRTDKAGRKL